MILRSDRVSPLAEKSLFIDTHAHLYYKDLQNQLDHVVRRAESAGVDKIICVGTDLASSRTSIVLCEQYPNLFATVGIHPHDSKHAPPFYLDEIRDLTSHPGVVAIGEMGLDFYRKLSPEDIQIEVFRDQLELAKELNFPAVIHNRNADESVIRIIKTVGHTRGVLHCFSSGREMADRVLESGLKISFTGSVTYGDPEIESIVKSVSLKSIMLETDSPYLSPVPKRGERNEPSNLPLIASKIAEIKNINVDRVAAITTETSNHFFNLPL